MLNYMKSEGYRILHSRGMYLFTGITAAAVFFLNWLLSCQGQIPYATAHFSLGMLVGSPMLYCYMALLAAGIMFGEDRKNGMMRVRKKAPPSFSSPIRLCLAMASQNRSTT